MALNDPGKVVTAIGGLGTAAFGLMDAAKPIFGINHIGFGGIRAAVVPLVPDLGQGINAMPQNKILATLQANWMNGTDLGSQKSIAKSLIKLGLNTQNSRSLADATGVDGNILNIVATKIAAGTSLNASESDVFARFDFIVTSLLDEAYQRSDQVYRNWTRLLAAAVAVALALCGEVTFHTAGSWPVALIVGLMATPLAPIAKDVSTALATAVNTLQLAKK